MPWVKLNLDGKEIILTPGVLKEARTQILAQYNQMTLGEILNVAGALNLSIGQILTFFKGAK